MITIRSIIIVPGKDSLLCYYYMNDKTYKIYLSANTRIIKSLIVATHADIAMKHEGLDK